MKQISFLLAGLSLLLSAPVSAQDSGEVIPNYPSIETGFYRLVNHGFGDVVNLNQPYDISPNQTEESAKYALGSVFYYDTDGLYSLIDDLRALEQSENFDAETLQALMNYGAWKSACYTTYDLTSQGYSLRKLGEKLQKYAYDAMENYIASDEVEQMFNENRSYLIFVAVTGLFPNYTADIENITAFRNYLRWYFTKWKPYFDFSVYLMPAVDTEDEFYVKMRTPLQVGNVKQIQKWVNDLRRQDGKDTVDFWNYAKERVKMEVAKEYPEGTPAYTFYQRIIDQLVFSSEHLIGENENGEIIFQPYSSYSFDGVIPIDTDLFGWHFVPVNEQHPVSVTLPWKDTAGNYYATFCSEFPYQLLDGEAYYVSKVENGQAQLVKIEGKVPAATGVILRSTGSELKLVPVLDEVPALEDNLLVGQLLAGKPVVPGTYAPFTISDGKLGFGMQPGGMDGNNVALLNVAENPFVVVADADVTAIARVNAGEPRQSAIFDLQGRRVVRPQKGLYIQDGKKYVAQ